MLQSSRSAEIADRDGRREICNESSNFYIRRGSKILIICRSRAHTQPNKPHEPHLGATKQQATRMFSGVRVFIAMRRTSYSQVVALVAPNKAKAAPVNCRRDMLAIVTFASIAME